jgi:hypothetical protein
LQRSGDQNAYASVPTTLRRLPTKQSPNARHGE